MKVRGSIPLFWSQPETWKLKPSIVPITDLSKHAMALKTHLLDLSKHYLSRNSMWKLDEKNNEKEVIVPAITFINLIDKSGSQGKLGEMFFKYLFERR